jgi:hypothetical protein
MTSANVMAHVRKGMEVKTSDGTELGTIAHVWFGVDPVSSNQPCDEEECSRLEVQLPHRRGTRYIPYNAIATVSGRIVTLNVTEATVNNKLWHQRPAWLPPESPDEDFDHLRRPHPAQGNS